MRHFVIAAVVSALFAGLMWIGWGYYRDFLTQGSRPSYSVQKLNAIEQGGAPQFSLPDPNGKVHSLSEFAGKVIIINFWASWCDPCVEEFPSLLNLVEKFKGEVVLVAVSGDHNEKELKQFLRVFDFNKPGVQVLWDKELKVAGQYGTQVLPESYILSKRGRMVKKVVGIDKWDTPEAFRFFEELVRETDKRSEGD